MEALWTLGQTLNEARATAATRRSQTASVRARLAHQAGGQWRDLLAYLEGTGDLRDGARD